MVGCLLLSFGDAFVQNGTTVDTVPGPPTVENMQIANFGQCKSVGRQNRWKHCQREPLLSSEISKETTNQSQSAVVLMQTVARLKPPRIELLGRMLQ